MMTDFVVLGILALTVFSVFVWVLVSGKKKPKETRSDYSRTPYHDVWREGNPSDSGKWYRNNR